MAKEREPRCAGKLALITGAAQGLGRAHATRLAEEGARVLCTDINGDGAAETASLINEQLGSGTGGRHFPALQAYWRSCHGG